MLPFLQPRQVSTSIIAGRGAGSGMDVNPEIDHTSLPSGIKAAAEDVMKAFDKRSVVDLAHALRNLFDEFDSEPHKEGPHDEEDEYGE